MNELRTGIVLTLSGNLEARAKRFGQSLDSFSRRGQQQMGMLSRSITGVGRALESMGGKWTATLAGAGATYKATKAIMDSAGLDKQLIRIAQTAGATIKMAQALRAELHVMSQQTGQSLDDLLSGFNDLVQAGNSWDQSLAMLRAMNPTMAVTGSSANTLASALSVASESFKFDLSRVETAKLLLDQMTVAGRLGNAELEDLSGIFARVGVNAKSANLGFTDTLAFIEQLSLIERQPERLATLADSTLRLFTNQKYMQKAAGATGVRFYDAKGERREALDVLQEIASKYKKLNSAAAKDNFLANAFEGADLDTIRGLRVLLDGDALFKVRDVTKQIADAAGTISRDLPDAINNSVDQVARLKGALREAADGFAEPVNDTINRAIKYLMDEKGVTGDQMLVGGAVAAGGLIAGAKVGGKLLQKVGGAAGGLAAGKAMEEFAGVTPVYVVNMPGGGIPGLPGGKPGLPGSPGGAAAAGKAGLAARAGQMLKMGVASAPLAAVGGGVAASGLAGYGIGTLINDKYVNGSSFGDRLGRNLNVMAALLGSKDAKAALAADGYNSFGTKLNEAANKISNAKAKIEIEIKGAPATVRSMRANNLDMDVSSGLTMQGN